MGFISKFSITTGFVVVFISLTLIFGLIAYKYNEYAVLKKYVALYNDNWRKELRLTEISSANSNEFSQIADKNSTRSAETEGYDFSEEITAINLIDNNSKGYRKTLEENKNRIKNSPINEKIIFGKKGAFVDRLKKLQLAYYDLELERNKRNQVLIYFMQNFYPLAIDYAVMEEYDKKGTKNIANYSNNFYEIQVLEKYSNPGYTFDYEEEIKKHLPKGHDALDRYRKYFASYYSLVKDYVAGDVDSAAYKYSGLQDRALELGIDWDQLYKDTRSDEAVKQTIEVVRDQSKLIKNFEAENGLKLPIIGVVGNFEEDLVMCQLYHFKAMSLYQPLKNKYPTAKTTDDLINEISSISPRTEEIDSIFDRNVMKIINEDDKITFICKDSKGEEFVYTSLKD